MYTDPNTSPATWDAFMRDLRSLTAGMPRPLDVCGVVIPAVRRRGYMCDSATIACALKDRLGEDFDWGNRYRFPGETRS
jgi:hypothetical protein